MNKRAFTLICVVIALCMAVSAFAGSSKGFSVYKATSNAYNGATTRIAETEGHVTEILRNTFGLFNPCMDLVKGCSRLVFAPLEAPFNYLARSKAKTKSVRYKKGQQIPVPKKPDIPKQ